jgi:hypothetical protein
MAFESVVIKKDSGKAGRVNCPSVLGGLLSLTHRFD